MSPTTLIPVFFRSSNALKRRRFPSCPPVTTARLGSSSRGSILISTGTGALLVSERYTHGRRWIAGREGWKQAAERFERAPKRRCQSGRRTSRVRADPDALALPPSRRQRAGVLLGFPNKETGSDQRTGRLTNGCGIRRCVVDSGPSKVSSPNHAGLFLLPPDADRALCSALAVRGEHGLVRRDVGAECVPRRRQRQVRDAGSRHEKTVTYARASDEGVSARPMGGVVSSDSGPSIVGVRKLGPRDSIRVSLRGLRIR